MISLKILFYTSITILSCNPLFAKIINNEINNDDLIYGNDDRYEVEDYQSQLYRNYSNSIAIRVDADKLTEDRANPQIVNFPHTKLSERIENICPTERFIDQYSVGSCSGFLVSKNLLVTAGHCMQTLNDCEGKKWIFDFKEQTNTFKKADIYSCKKIISQKYNYSNKEVNDYAVIELDRPVFDRLPLPLRKHGYVTVGTPVLVIGHPLGLPMKITDGAKVSRMNDDERVHRFRTLLNKLNYFNANLDSYGGNSGSPVFNQNTGKVEGILVQGAEDFVFDQKLQCVRSNRLSNSFHNTYEKVMRITKVPGL